MNQQKCIYGIIEVIILAFIALLAFTVFNTEYLFQWATHNWKFYLVLGVIALFFILWNKPVVSAFLTAGIVLGIFIGNFLGELIKQHNSAKIIEGMKAEEVYRLQHHPGFEIWIGIILLFLVIGIGVQRSKR